MLVAVLQTQSIRLGELKPRSSKGKPITSRNLTHAVGRRKLAGKRGVYCAPVHASRNLKVTVGHIKNEIPAMRPVNNNSKLNIKRICWGCEGMRAKALRLYSFFSFHDKTGG